MKGVLIILIVHFSLPVASWAQGGQYAGEDQDACQGAGAHIGNPGASDVCYTWEPAEGLSPGDIHNQAPVVHPQTTTTYTVHVSGNNFSFSVTEQVTVEVDFGGLVITPQYIDLSGPLMDQAQATLIINDFQGGSDPIIWSIENAGSTGCVINQDGVISNCSESGTVTVKATNMTYPGCFAEKVLEINGGIKDVTAEDSGNQGRVAHNGDTLYLVGAGSATLTAVPNENSLFPAGQPTWSGSHTPPPNNEFTWTTPTLNPGQYNYTAGEVDPKSVTVINLGENATTLQFGLQSKLLLDMVNAMRGNTVEKQLDPFCTPPLNFDLSAFASMKASYKSANSVKFRDPGYDTKYEVSIEIPALSFEGCMFFPCCSGGANFGVASAFYFTYLKAGLGLGFTGTAVRDPAVATPAEWKFSNLSASVSGTIEGGLRLEVNVPSGFGVLGAAILSTDAKLEARGVLEPNQIEWNASWGGLVGKVSLGIWYLSMDNILEVSQQKNFINGREMGWTPLYTFPN